jgi:hypothetical protein
MELIPFQHFGNWEFKSEGVVRQGVPTHEIMKCDEHLLDKAFGHSR